MLFKPDRRGKYLTIIILFVMVCLPTTGSCDEYKEATSLRLELKSLGSDRVEVRVVNDGPRVEYIINLFIVPNNKLNFIIKDNNNVDVPYFGDVAKIIYDERDLVRLGKGYFVGVEKNLRDLGNYRDSKNGYRLSKGSYRVTAVYSISDVFKNHFKSRELWTGKLTSNEIVIEVE